MFFTENKFNFKTITESMIIVYFCYSWPDLGQCEKQLLLLLLLLLLFVHAWNTGLEDK